MNIHEANLLTHWQRMNNNVKLLRLSHLNIQFFVTALSHHIWFNFTKSTSLVVQIVDVQLRDIELVEVEISVEMQLRVIEDVAGEDWNWYQKKY
jgi:hypothetical protein